MNDIERLALEIAKSKIPCDKCIYVGPDIMCLYPHTDLYIEENGLQGCYCYKGVLLYLLEQAKHTEIKDRPDI